jgi:hypothetical protein
MTDDFEKRFESLQEMCRSIAQIEIDNWFTINEYQKVQAQIEEIKAKTRNDFAGKEIASEELVRKTVSEIRAELERADRVPVKSKRRETRRITGPMKLQVLRAMLHDLAERKVETVTLEDIERWCRRSNRNKASEILNELGIGDVSIPSTQFFRTLINGQSVCLYPDQAYERQSAPFPAYFDVTKWKAWLDQMSFTNTEQERNKHEKD